MNNLCCALLVFLSACLGGLLTANAGLSAEVFALQASDARRLDRGDHRAISMRDAEKQALAESLPEINTFQTDKSDQFLVDLTIVRTGHPYKGEHAHRPHSGGHVYFRSPERSVSRDDPATYPAIYAVADGVISRIDYWFRLKEMYEPALGRRIANYRYGIGLTFATKDGNPVDFHYSIEPFVDPGDENFYEPFILVEVGQRVKQSDIIARMYIPPNRQLSQKSHIHFNLIDTKTRHFMAPSIFHREIVKRFHATWGQFGKDGNELMPASMGYKLAPHENPFRSGAKESH